ncbi:MAG: HAMP domain-containing histidine kinase [Caldilineaceae bacterium]|nr:HAMP domain-containing histidine kinase [Caldilineaceae bacterium]
MTGANASAPITPPPGRWPWQRSLQVRMILAFGGTFLVILALLTFWISREVYRTYIDSAEHDLEVAAFLAANALEDPLSGYANEFEQYQRWEAEHQLAEAGKSADDERNDKSDDDDEHDDDSPPATATPAPPSPPSVEIVLPRLQGVADLYAKDSGARVTILDSAGHAVADSHYPIATVGRQSDQPEFAAALAGNELGDIRPDPATGKQTMYTAAPIQQGSDVLGIVQLSKPMEVVEENARALLMSVLLAGLAAVVASTLLAIWIARQLVRPIERMETAALAAAGGDLSHQVPVQTSDELGALASAFNYMVGEVRTMLEQQRAFVANASHELRTPLTNILGYSRIIAEDAGKVPTQEIVEMASTIIDNGERLNRMLENYLVYAQLELIASDEEELKALTNHITGNVQDLIRQEAEYIAKHSDRAFDLEVQAEKMALMISEKNLQKIIVELVDNAFKFSLPGSPVRVCALRNGQFYEICVSDQGRGMSAEQVKHIGAYMQFERLMHEQQGLGLGLIIAKRIAELHDGGFEIQSMLDTGTTVCVRLPL